MRTRVKKGDRWRDKNEKTAGVVLADPLRYPSMMQEWAWLILNAAAETTPKRAA